MESSVKKRNSGIELLKIFAMTLIILSHSMPDQVGATLPGSIDIDTVTNNMQLILAGFIKNFGQIGNNIFLMCSIWFLLGSEKVKINKVSNMIGDCFFISVLGFVVFTLLGYRFPASYILKQFMPVTFSCSWYLTCYLLLYAIHPILNHGIKAMSKEKLLLFILIYFVLYNCMGFVMDNSLFYYSHLIGFIGIYFMVSYVKNYMTNHSSDLKLNLVMLVIGIAGWICSSGLTALLGSKFGFFAHAMQRWNKFMNPCFILIALSLFNILRQKQFYNAAINYISSLSLLVYMIHTNRIIRDYVRFDLFAMIESKYGFQHILLWILLFAIVSAVGATLLAIIYNKSFQKIIHKIFEGIAGLLLKIYNRISSFILKLD